MESICINYSCEKCMTGRCRHEYVMDLFTKERRKKSTSCIKQSRLHTLQWTGWSGPHWIACVLKWYYQCVSPTRKYTTFLPSMFLIRTTEKKETSLFSCSLNACKESKMNRPTHCYSNLSDKNNGFKSVLNIIKNIFLFRYGIRRNYFSMFDIV